jgi:hypothetical protein
MLLWTEYEALHPDGLMYSAFSAMAPASLYRLHPVVVGGVPNIVVPDKLKSGVTRAHRYDPDLNPTYQDGHPLRRRRGARPGA